MECTKVQKDLTTKKTSGLGFIDQSSNLLVYENSGARVAQDCAQMRRSCDTGNEKTCL